MKTLNGAGSLEADGAQVMSLASECARLEGELVGESGLVADGRLEVGGRFLAVAVERRIQIGDGAGSAEGFQQKGVVGPSSSGNVQKADAVFPQEIGLAERGPDGGMVFHRLGAGGDDGRALNEPAARYRRGVGRRWHALVVEVYERLIGCVGERYAPIGVSRYRGRSELLPPCSSCWWCALLHSGCRRHALLPRQRSPWPRWPLAAASHRVPECRFSPLGLIDTAVARDAVALVCLVDDVDALILGGVLLQHVQRIVGRPVVEADDLQVRISLLAQAAQRPIRVRLCVEHGHHDADEGSKGVGSRIVHKADILAVGIRKSCTIMP